MYEDTENNTLKWLGKFIDELAKTQAGRRTIDYLIEQDREIRVCFDETPFLAMIRRVANQPEAIYIGVKRISNMIGKAVDAPETIFLSAHLTVHERRHDQDITGGIFRNEFFDCSEKVSHFLDMELRADFTRAMDNIERRHNGGLYSIAPVEEAFWERVSSVLDKDWEAFVFDDEPSGEFFRAFEKIWRDETVNERVSLWTADYSQGVEYDLPDIKGYSLRQALPFSQYKGSSVPGDQSCCILSVG